MIKHDYGHLKCPFYLDKVTPDFEICLIPRVNNVNSALLHISKGAYVDSSLNYKVGTAYYLANAIMDPTMIKDYAKKGILLENEVTHSYTNYYLTSLSLPLYDSINDLFNRINTISYTEDSISKFKESDLLRAKEDENDTIVKTEQVLAKALYFSSPIQNSILPNYLEANSIHSSLLKRFQENYYTADKMILFLSVNEDPRESLKQIKTLKLPKRTNNIQTKIIKDDDYEKVNHDYIELTSTSLHSYLSYGIKFPSRESLYSNYGDAIFFIYEIMMDLVFNKNDIFLSSISSLRADFVSSKFVQAGEDSYICLTFRTENGQEVCDFIAKYLSKLEKRVNNKFFEQIKNEYYIRSLQKLSSPYQLVREFANSYPNHISYPSLISHSMKLNISTIKKFLYDLRDFRRACAYSKKK